MTDETEKPEVYYGAMEGGHVVSITSWNEIGAQAALVLAEKESGLTGWQFKTNAVFLVGGKGGHRHHAHHNRCKQKRAHVLHPFLWGLMRAYSTRNRCGQSISPCRAVP